MDAVPEAAPAVVKPPLAPAPPALQAALLAMDGAIAAPTEEFLRTYDDARCGFMRTPASRDLPTALLAVKLFNLLLTKHEYMQRSVAKIARPIGFMLDPANACQLGCPGCTNSFNRAYADATYNPWPKVIMKPDTFARFIDDVGLTAFCGHFYNNSEPLINKHAAAYFRQAADQRIETFISTNLSLPINAEALVASGLREMMVAIDGVTQPVYERYRRGGDVTLVFENVRAIVAARAKLGSPTPRLRWQYLTFAHNVGEIEAAVAMARQLGFDSFNLATPFPVDKDAPDVIAVAYDGPAERDVSFQPAPPPFDNDLTPLADRIFAALAEGAEERYAALPRDAREAVPSDGRDQCDWLHLNVIADAAGRIVPCCKFDYRDQRRFVLADVHESSGNLLDSPSYREARLMTRNRSAYMERYGARPRAEQLRCERCHVRPLPQIGLGAVDGYLQSALSPALTGMVQALHPALIGWSAHRHEFRD
jgi:hypothetical protein